MRSKEVERRNTNQAMAGGLDFELAVRRPVITGIFSYALSEQSIEEAHQLGFPSLAQLGSRPAQISSITCPSSMGGSSSDAR